MSFEAGISSDLSEFVVGMIKQTNIKFRIVNGDNRPYWNMTSRSSNLDLCTRWRLCVCVWRASMCRKNQTENVACCVLRWCTRLDAHTVCRTRWRLFIEKRGYSIRSIMVSSPLICIDLFTLYSVFILLLVWCLCATFVPRNRVLYTI